MKKLAIYVTAFAFGNLAAWFVFWCSGEAMFTYWSGLAALGG